MIIDDDQSISSTQYPFLYGGDRVEMLTDSGVLLEIIVERHYIVETLRR